MSNTETAINSICKAITDLFPAAKGKNHKDGWDVVPCAPSADITSIADHTLVTIFKIMKNDGVVTLALEKNNQSGNYRAAVLENDNQDTGHATRVLLIPHQCTSNFQGWTVDYRAAKKNSSFYNTLVTPRFPEKEMTYMSTIYDTVGFFKQIITDPCFETAIRPSMTPSSGAPTVQGPK